MIISFVAEGRNPVKTAPARGPVLLGALPLLRAGFGEQGWAVRKFTPRVTRLGRASLPLAFVCLLCSDAV